MDKLKEKGFPPQHGSFGADMQVESINVIDEAKVPEKPSGPHRALICAIGAIAGLFIGIAIIILQDLLDKRVHNDDEVQELLGVAVLSHFPVVEE
jgi:capsular polysaccharide biosynthesis protein